MKRLALVLCFLFAATVNPGVAWAEDEKAPEAPADFPQGKEAFLEPTERPDLLEYMEKLKRSAESLVSLRVIALMGRLPAAAQTALVRLFASKATAVMTNGRFRHMPIVDDADNLVSIVSLGDLVDARMKRLEAELRSS